ncbi:MAG: hypothetical protein HGA87_01370 [Desulfobulbaceae bacterium]|nr:hypothetical protein [Desulfobulbaceae bacterium]
MTKSILREISETNYREAMRLIELAYISEPNPAYETAYNALIYGLQFSDFYSAAIIAIKALKGA